MKFIPFVLIYTLFFHTASSQVVPSFQTERLSGGITKIPDDTKGKLTLLCFAFSTSAQKDLETWMDPVYQHLIAKTGIMDGAFDVNVFFIPVFHGANQAMFESIKNKFNEAQDDLKPHILFCKSMSAEIRKQLRLDANDKPYLLLMDKEGNVIYRTEGAYSEAKWDDLDEKIE